MNTEVEKARDSNSEDAASSLRQDEVNRTVYNARFVYLHYISRSLMPAETACLSKYEQYLSGRDILDIGVGAGRTSRYLAPLARRYEAIDYSPVMVQYVKRTLPQISVNQADFRDLRSFEDGSFDFVFATANVIDTLSHQDRLRALSEVSRVLRPGGILAFSTHNIHHMQAFSGPRLDWSWNPIRLGFDAVKYLLGSWNYPRVAPLRTTTPEYALLNDPGHFYACLHYYVARPTVSSQLAGAGMRLLDVFDTRGNVVVETDDDSENPWLLYVGQRYSSV
jgi:SAM-dependent methyltransferase